MKKVFVLRKGKIYPLSKRKKESEKVYSRVDKKKIQDYWYLNKWIIKNNYLLPLISDIVENIGTKKIFTKLDLKIKIQQYKDKRERWVESGLYNIKRVIWTNSYVFWFDKFTGD